mgnify:CR=1 FL=1
MEDYIKRTHCRYCESGKLVSILDLGKHPPSDSFIYSDETQTEKKYPLELFLCENCFLLQLMDVISPTLLFGEEFLYQSSTSTALRNHYTHLTEMLTRRFEISSGDTVVDIGCNDGIILNTFKTEGLNTVGVEPSELANIARKHGHYIFRDFFNLDCAKSIISSFGHAKVITATNVFPHVDQIRGFVEGILELIGTKGIFVIEASYMPDFIDKILFDTIYHEHLCYLGLTPLKQFLESMGLEVFDIERTSLGASGPAFRILIQKYDGQQPVSSSVERFLFFEKQWGISNIRNYFDFADKVKITKTNILNLLNGFKSSNVEIGGYGAPAKGNTLLNYLEVNQSLVSYIADNNPLKQGKITPGSHIPVISDEEFLQKKPTHALLLAWNYLDFFLKNSEYIQQGGKFIVPLPSIQILP